MKLIKNNKGLSLIEIIVAVAIIAVLFLGIASFMQSSTTYYGRTKKETKLQNESQTVFRTVSDTLKNSNFFQDGEKSLEIKAKFGTKEWVMVKKDPIPNTIYKEYKDIFIKDIADTKYMANWKGNVSYIFTGTQTIVYDADNKSVYLNGVTKTAAGGANPMTLITPDLTLDPNNLISNKCINFQIDLSRIDSKVIRVTMEFRNDSIDRNFMIENDVLIRNDYIFYDKQDRKES